MMSRDYTRCAKGRSPKYQKCDLWKARVGLPLPQTEYNDDDDTNEEETEGAQTNTKANNYQA